MLSPPILGILAVVLLLALIALRLPLAFCLFSTGLFGLLYMMGVEGTISLSKTFYFAKIANWGLLAVPMFVLMGHLAAAAGVSDKAYEVAYKWLRGVPGSLALSTVGACAMFGACCGSSTATVGTFGRVALPEMLKYGYDKKLAAGATCCGSLLAIMIPPSVIFVIYGIVTGTSIGHLLIAGILPGILTAFVFMAGIFILVARQPGIAPKGSPVSLKEKIIALKDIWGVVLLFLCIIGGIYSGVFTATEAAAAGAFITLILALAKGRKNLSNIGRCIAETTEATSMVFLLMIGSFCLSLFFVVSGVTEWFVAVVVSLPVPPTLILVPLLLIYIPLGMVVDAISMMLITLPVIFPVIIALGYDPIWFGVLITKLNEVALITPPVGMNLYVLKAVAPPEISLEDILRGSFWFLVMEMVTLAILIAFPQISLFLPGLMK